MAEALYRLGRMCALRAWWVVGAWLAIIGLAVVGYLVGGGTLSSMVSIPGTETARVSDELRARFPAASGGTGTLVAHTTDGQPFTAEQKAQVAALLAQLAKVEGVRAVTDPFQATATGMAQAEQLAAGREQLQAAQAKIDAGRAQLGAAQAKLDAARAQAAKAGAPAATIAALDAQRKELDAQRKALEANAAELATQAAKLANSGELMQLAAGIRMVSEDGSAALVPVMFVADVREIPPATKEAVGKLVATADIPGVAIEPSNELTEALPEILGIGEILGILVAGLALQLMLGTAIAAALPIVSALVGVAVGVCIALAFSGSVDMLSVTPVLGVMLGLAVGIDYCLFILNRHRHQLREGVAMTESIGLATGTSGNAVVFAGSTVLVALLALNVTGISFLGLMGTVGAFCVLTAILVAITLTPALLSLIGMRVLPRKLRDEPEPVDLVNTPMSTRSATLRLLGSLVILLVIAIPALSMRLGLPDGSSEPQDSSAYRAFSITAEKFGAGINGPLLVVATLPEATTEDGALAEQVRIGKLLAENQDVAAVAPIGVSSDGLLLAFQVVPREGPNSESTSELVTALRATTPTDGAVALGVAGAASGNIDVSTKLADSLPIYLLLVVGISLLIMMAVFRSILVPITATLGFVLSVFAAFGGIVAIFQWGWLGPIFGVQDPGPVLSFLPTILIGVLFGLAMDYQLFLVSGMREAFIHGVPARIAVRRGFNAGRVVVTVAAIIMISVFAGFISSEMAVVRSMGFGLAFGVALDAFVVRMLAIPAVMHLAGEKAWWLPKWLDRILPNVDVEGAKLERTHPHPTHWDAPAKS